ncbi:MULTISPECIES: GntR family transcriptional regulator [unclassified Mycolicibacterium]|uniref:GntR family transcriptional regulator n=1 Tax=unclassified Mycolicibacterium TaxID=2636767 RepID=UPI0012DC2A16|nr:MULTISPECIES: GntR family transcriptional regulator [unclassified Mycolicibacterium]MUL84739.1 GntR family transcriptional regulator [Mycolicibacterium sp. CBMA 329]MUL88514.1 GntR family transcriptional regulator [Mycolicibacterium sp. CBMA 331]MUM00147.1 GntR family transcriptional regulator [Mycolicibacterium sp. CBMA 334]MUM27811.1 GntR family transcriptional regulator [Mycolicibacterium sp. CBMA 295]MUM40161.1 GntR family transcriptional regulator [Mycolicibacterium sp. CBMA 247]
MTTAAASLTDEAHQRIRADIVSGQIRPNVHLVAADLAERLAISRTPVREALKLLASEGLVIATGRGFIVREHTKDEVREIYEVRAALEEMAARLVAERGTAQQIHAIAQIGAHHASVARDDRAVLVERNLAFHNAIMETAGNRLLARINQRNSEQFFNHRIAELYSDDEATAAIQGHGQILDALSTHDPDAAASAARQHVLEAMEVTLRTLR